MPPTTTAAPPTVPIPVPSTIPIPAPAAVSGSAAADMRRKLDLIDAAAQRIEREADAGEAQILGRLAESIASGGRQLLDDIAAAIAPVVAYRSPEYGQPEPEALRRALTGTLAALTKAMQRYGDADEMARTALQELANQTAARQDHLHAARLRHLVRGAQ